MALKNTPSVATLTSGYALALLILIPVCASAQLTLPRLISDGMVLQRDTEVKVRGWATPGESVELTFRDSVFTFTADGSGYWAAHLPEMEAGGPYTMKVESDTVKTVENIMIGEVWVASGQSNMELPMERVKPLYREEIASADYPEIRFFEVPKRYNFDFPEQEIPSGEWISVDTSSIHQLSAAAYFYARHLHNLHEVPVGIINSSMGGSPAEAWLSEDALKAFPGHHQQALRFRDDALIEQIENDDRQRISAWHDTAFENDRGYQNASPWHSDNTDISGWNAMNIPGYWADVISEPVNGVFWFRKEIEVPESMAGKSAKLEAGRIVDADSTFVNGEFVGNTTYQYPPRWYEIPENTLREGTNNITVRVVNERGRGGFIPDKPYEITTETDTIDLKGEWKYRIGVEMEPLEGQTFIRWKPLGLYNAMIAPLTDYSISGVIWYQGESNTGRPEEYAELFPSLIEDWRANWNQGDFPFLYVQLANYMAADDHPTDSNWARLREAQLRTLEVPNTAMAVAIDIGEWNDIHPLNKKDVGKRLALAARKLAYHEDLVYSGPIYRSMKIDGHEIRLKFDHTGSGLTTPGDESLEHFAIAGEDQQFVWAEARIEGDEVVVHSDEVENPVHVRYGWADNPASANLYNREGLPASPFRTDDW